MNRIKLFLVALLVPLGLWSCAEMQQVGDAYRLGTRKAEGGAYALEAVPSGKAQVVFYRPSAFMLRGRDVFLSIPKEANNCHAMVNAGFWVHVASPGRLNVVGSVAGEEVDFFIDLKEGETRYVKVIPYEAGFLQIVARFEEVPAQAATGEVAPLRRIDVCAK